MFILHADVLNHAIMEGDDEVERVIRALKRQSTDHIAGWEPCQKTTKWHLYDSHGPPFTVALSMVNSIIVPQRPTSFKPESAR